MFALGGLELILLTLVLWAVAAFALYWIIRLAVRGGASDALRAERRESAARGRGEPQP